MAELFEFGCFPKQADAGFRHPDYTGRRLPEGVR